MNWLVVVSGLMLCAASIASARAEDAPPPNSDGPIIEAIKGGKPIIDVRYRFEWKRQDGFAQDAYANTVRTRLGFESGELYDFKFLLEFENVASIGEDHFNSTTNGLVVFPVISDPDATEINRAQITFTGIPKTTLTVGRQLYNLANQRFVGAVDFRQNQQTFDAARASFNPVKNISVDYLYIDRVHRVFGDDHPLGEFDSDSHVIAATYDGKKLGKITGYALILDFEEAPALSSSTWGVRYENTFTLESDAGIKLGAVAEFASQRDHAGNPFDYRETYAHGEVALIIAPAALRVGYERLGGSGAIGFATPLATLHKFQGFADVFLTTPASGIEDLYGTVNYQWADAPFGTRIDFFATYHRFESELGDADFGDEIDAGVAVNVRKHWSVEIKGARYAGASGLADRSLIWASLRFQY